MDYSSKSLVISCPSCTQTTKVLLKNNLFPDLPSLACPDCYPEPFLDSGEYEIFFLPIISQDQANEWIISGSIKYDVDTIINYIERCLLYGYAHSEVIIKNKTVLSKLVDLIPQLFPINEPGFISREDFELRFYPNLHKQVKLKKLYSRLSEECDERYNKYCLGKSLLIRLKRLRRRINMIKPINLGLNTASFDQGTASSNSDLNTASFDHGTTSSNSDLNTASFNHGTALLNLPYNKLFWEILPQGEQPFIAAMNYFDSMGHMSSAPEFDQDRLLKIANLGPTRLYGGKKGFLGYIIYYFDRQEIAVLESPMPNNAIYVIRGDWFNLSQLSKAELLWYHNNVVTRIIHKGDWLTRLKIKLLI